MISVLGRVLETIGLLLTSSGIIGEPRLTSIEEFLRKQIANLLSRQGYQVTIQKSLEFAQGKTTPVTKSFFYIWVVFDYLAKSISGVLTLGVIALIFFPELWQGLSVWFEINLANVLRVLARLMIYLFGILALELLILMFMGRATFKPFKDFAQLYFEHNEKERHGAESRTDVLIQYIQRVFQTLRDLEHKPKNETLRYIFSKRPLRIAALAIALPFLLIYGICGLIWLVFYFLLYLGPNMIIITLFHLSLSLLHVIVIAVSLIGYVIAFILLFPYSLLDRMSERLKLSTIIVLGIILSIIGIWLK